MLTQYRFQQNTIPKFSADFRPRRPVFTDHLGPRLSLGETVHRLRLTSKAQPLTADDGAATLPLVATVTAETLTFARSARRAVRTTTTAHITTTRHRVASAASPGQTVSRSGFDASRAVSAALSSTDDEAIVLLVAASKENR